VRSGDGVQIGALQEWRPPLFTVCWTPLQLFRAVAAVPQSPSRGSRPGTGWPFVKFKFPITPLEQAVSDMPAGL
jgi:hypothetical protein